MEELPPDSIAIIDSSMLFAMGGPSNEKYQAFERHVTGRNVTVRLPDHIAEELGESPDAYAYQRDRLSAAADAGWLERAHVDFTNPAVSDVIDRTRNRIANRSADDVTEDEVERADTVLAGLAYQYAIEESAAVTVLVSDRVAEQATDDVLSAMGVDDRAGVVEGREFLGALVGEEWG